MILLMIVSIGGFGVYGLAFIPTGNYTDSTGLGF
jgi:hypothetical protein